MKIRNFSSVCRNNEQSSQQRFKLFSKLGIEKVVNYSKEECWTASLTEGEIFMLDEAFWLRSTVSDMEESSWFYIYVAFKEGRKM